MRYLLFFLLFLLSFVVFPFGVSQFESPKIIAAELGLLTLIVFFFFGPDAKKIFNNRIQLLLITVLLFLSLTHLIFAWNDTTLFGNAFRMQGVFLLWLLLGLSMVSGFITLPKVPGFAFVLLLILHGIFSVLIVGNTDRAIGTLGEPNALSAGVIFLWPWVFKNHPVSNKYQKLLFSFAAFIALLIIFMSGSRSGLVAFAIQCAVLLLFYFKISFPKTAMVGTGLIILSLFLPLFQTNPYENRAEIWKTALIAGYEHPIAGWGFGNTEKALEEYGWKLYTGSHDYYVDSSHNMFLDYWIQGGFIGLSILVLFVYLSLRHLIRRREKLLLILFLGVVTVALFNPVSVVTLVQLWWLIGQGFSTKTS